MLSINKNARPLGSVQVPCDTAQGLTVPLGTAYVTAVAEAQACRWRDDGTNPTAAVGYPQSVGQEFQINSPATFKVIGQVAGCILNVSFYGAS